MGTGSRPRWPSSPRKNRRGRVPGITSSPPRIAGPRSSRGFADEIPLRILGVQHARKGVVMSRRIIPGTFGVGMMLCSLLIAAKLWASGPPDRMPDLRGHWDGFFLAADNGGVRGLVGSDI